MNTTTTVEARLSRLETQNRRQRGAIVALAGVVVAAVGVGWSASQAVPDLIQAKRFEVIGHEGNAAVTIEANDHGGSISVVSNKVVTISSHKGRAAVKIEIDPLVSSSSGSIKVVHPNGGTIAYMGGNNSEIGGGRLIISNPSGNLGRAGMRADENGGAVWVATMPQKGPPKSVALVTLTEGENGGVVTVRNLAGKAKTIEP